MLSVTREHSQHGCQGIYIDSVINYCGNGGNVWGFIHHLQTRCEDTTEAWILSRWSRIIHTNTWRFISRLNTSTLWVYLNRLKKRKSEMKRKWSHFFTTLRFILCRFPPLCVEIMVKWARTDGWVRVIPKIIKGNDGHHDQPVTASSPLVLTFLFWFTNQHMKNDEHHKTKATWPNPLPTSFTSLLPFLWASHMKSSMDNNVIGVCFVELFTLLHEIHLTNRRKRKTGETVGKV